MDFELEQILHIQVDTREHRLSLTEHLVKRDALDINEVDLRQAGLRTLLSSMQHVPHLAVAPAEPVDNRQHRYLITDRRGRDDTKRNDGTLNVRWGQFNGEAAARCVYLGKEEGSIQCVPCLLSERVDLRAS